MTDTDPRLQLLRWIAFLVGGLYITWIACLVGFFLILWAYVGFRTGTEDEAAS